MSSKLTDLTVLSGAMSPTDYIYVVTGGDSRKCLASQIRITSTQISNATAVGAALMIAANAAAGRTALGSTTVGDALFIAANAAAGRTALALGTFAVEAVTAVPSLTFADLANIGFNTGTGTKIGTDVGQKIGFWNATPIVQPAGATQAAPAAYATGAFGLDSDANMHALYDLVVAIRTALVNAGIMKGAA